MYFALMYEVADDYLDVIFEPMTGLEPVTYGLRKRDNGRLDPPGSRNDTAGSDRNGCSLALVRRLRALFSESGQGAMASEPNAPDGVPSVVRDR